MKKLSKQSRTSFFTYGGVILAYVLLQLYNGQVGLSSMIQGLLVPICAYVTMALALNLVVGVSGELSLGHAGFMSVGAFSGTAAAIALQGVIPLAPLRLAVAMVIGALFAALAGFLIGIPVLRLNGDYLAIVTLAFGEIIKSVLNNLYVGFDTTGFHFSFLADTVSPRMAEGGKLIIGGPMGISGIPIISTFTAGVVLVLVALVVIFNLVNSRAGRAIMAARDNRIAAESVGINVTKYKMIAFVISAALAGAAGSLYTMSLSTIVANKFDFNTSILILVFVVLGGMGNMWGAILSATFLTLLPELLRKFNLDQYRMLVYAVVLILVMIATNNPFLQRVAGNAAARFKRKKPAPAVEGGQSHE